MELNEYTRAVKANSNRLYLIALSYTKSHYDAEDIVQEVFTKLWKKNPDFNDEEHLKKWLTTCCINKSKDFLRMSFFKRNTALEDAMELYSFDKYNDYDLFSTVMKLPKNQSLAIHLFYYEDYSVKEIAEYSGVSEAVIKTRLHRARKQLKEMLGDEWLNE